MAPNKKAAVADKAVPVGSSDADMQAAIEKARATLPTFWKTFDKPENGETGFAIKVTITDDNGTEHFWANQIEKKDGKIFATINNDPNTVKSVKLGQRIEVAEEKISDWLFIRRDKMVGNYTLRVLLKTMPKAQADKFKAKLEEP